MKRKYAIFFALLLCCILVLTSCSNPLTSIREFFNKDEQTAEKVEPTVDEQESLSEVMVVQPDDARPTVMYYKDSDNILVPVMRYVPKNELGIAKAALNALVYSVEKAEDLRPTGLIPSLPMGTQILGAVIKENGHAIVDFSKEFLNFSSQKGEEVGVMAVVYTLSEFSNVKTVEIRVEGKALTEMPQGTKITTDMKRSKINLLTVENSGDKLSKVMVYYQKKGAGNYSYFVPVTKLTSEKNSAEAAINALLAGPTQESGLINPFPEGTQCLDIRVKDGVAYVNLSEDVLKLQGNKGAESSVKKAVSLTLGQFPEISKVQLFVNGTTVANTDGIGTNEFIDVPVFVNFYE
ncbi:MAG: GerMN protein [Clostridiales bacterium]|jgi:germination protein M|nr:GerMN protein [Clostridiales bacterium]